MSKKRTKVVQVDHRTWIEVDVKVPDKEAVVRFLQRQEKNKFIHPERAVRNMYESPKEK